MLAADIPVARDGAAQTGGDESEGGTERVHRDRGDPEDGPRRPTRETTGEPEQSGCRPPREDSLKVAVEPRIVARPDDGERGPADLHRHKRDRKQEPPLAERLGQGDGHDQGGHHGADQHHPHRSPVRIEPVGQPGRVDPGPPQRQQAAAPFAARRAASRCASEQMGQLGDREDDRRGRRRAPSRRPDGRARPRRAAAPGRGCRSIMVSSPSPTWSGDPISAVTVQSSSALDTGATSRFGYDRRPEKRALWRKAMTLGFPGPLDAAKAASCDSAPDQPRDGARRHHRRAASARLIDRAACAGDRRQRGRRGGRGRARRHGRHARSLWHRGRSLRHRRPPGYLRLGARESALPSTAAASLPVAPRSSSCASMARMRPSGRRVMAQRGPLSPSVPGFVDGCFALLERFGTRPFAELAAPAIAYAADGFPISPAEANSIASQRRAPQPLPGQCRGLPAGRRRAATWSRSCASPTWRARSRSSPAGVLTSSIAGRSRRRSRRSWRRTAAR